MRGEEEQRTRGGKEGEGRTGEEESVNLRSGIPKEQDVPFLPSCKCQKSDPRNSGRSASGFWHILHLSSN